MHVIIVTMQIKPEKVEDFKEFIRLDYEGTRQEPGNVRFDVVQHADDPTRFALYEIYRTPDDMAAHRQTPHFAHYIAHIEEYLVEPRTSTRYVGLYLT